jgi:hypothetical protein
MSRAPGRGETPTARYFKDLKVTSGRHSRRQTFAFGRDVAYRNLISLYFSKIGKDLQLLLLGIACDKSAGETTRTSFSIPAMES